MSENPGILTPPQRLRLDPYDPAGTETRYVYSDDNRVAYSARVDDRALRDWIIAASQMGPVVSVERYREAVEALKQAECDMRVARPHPYIQDRQQQVRRIDLVRAAIARAEEIL